ncbi:MAG: hypothetical protein K2H87_03430, partial [Duncaniella sp.]|nr:hypothetical protein [Duncaniella sp.]
MSTKSLLYCCAVAAGAAALVACTKAQAIDRQALVERNNPHITQIDTLASLTVGNGEFAFTVDVTGLQTFPELYRNGVPLGTQSQWGWHSFPNTEGLDRHEYLREYDFGRGHKELYADQFKEDGRQKDAANYFRVNPHRLHLGAIGFEGLSPEGIEAIDQKLDMWNGLITSNFAVAGTPVKVLTTVDPEQDMVAADITSTMRLPVTLRFPYPTGAHADDACDWTKDDLHSTEIVSLEANQAVLAHSLDSTTYYVTLAWQGAEAPVMKGRNAVTITPTENNWNFTATFTPEKPASDFKAKDFAAAEKAASDYWQGFWKNGGVVDFSECTDPRASELERRVVLSQYLLAVQCAGSTPPQ